MTALPELLGKIAECQACASSLPHAPRPVLRASTRSRILLAGQAPGSRVHQSGIPWDDASGRRLREWLGVDEAVFYNEDCFAIVPMGFCYPGTGANGDLPPRPECRRLWHPQLLPLLTDVRLVLAVGAYAQAYHLPDRKATLTETVAGWREYLPRRMPLPHPSPRNRLWLSRHRWFEEELLPELKLRVAAALES
ncbi:uracil-DNA glycosylase family protein [Chromobacterium subtsugae]|uniref:Uracil-DNA glycosylase family protein n=1 Tax=Chromobacterium subtsugae TaxID=251747 RepID=A0ABS7FEM4_9NEIS|nr:MULTISPECIES: uracil-DNA glycosylase family protein [Chromobacterium]KUM05265.1 uracil-DNA glycosylase [Chromobacterium subtsugae]KZE87722.1 uracil-DNA glycosylase [Chromobacterium sp. F49]MBW7568272.1 uracil-DNA glycosylase family protein [Chromobacterium subtsugae]MBW8288472.1 uracil-DNA glycosylase family protein [Chromobacterium subtsugae]WSE89918.1 uracil-DNA glycosylase family protein [Chromobacterium subtsugae]